jgi:hypothetical protein
MSLRRRHVYARPDLTGRKPATVVMSNGCGLDSMALLHQWCTDPATRDFPLDELLIITAIISSSTRV